MPAFHIHIQIRTEHFTARYLIHILRIHILQKNKTRKSGIVRTDYKLAALEKQLISRFRRMLGPSRKIIRILQADKQAVIVPLRLKTVF